MSLCENYLSVIILIIFNVFVTYWEKSKDGTIFTPFALLAWPYTLVVVLINVIGFHFGYFSVSLKCILFVLTGYIFYLIGGRVLIEFFIKDKIEYRPHSSRKINLQELFSFYRPLFVAMAIISIIVSIIDFQLSLKIVGGWQMITSNEFEKTYGCGIIGHIMMLNRPAFIYLFGDYLLSKKKYVLILLILMFITILLLQIKTHIFTTLLSGIIFGYLIGVLKINIKKIVIVCLIVAVVFNITYVIGFSWIGLTNVYSYKIQSVLINYFFSYLFGGAIAFSEVFKNAMFPIYRSEIIFSVPINIYHTLFTKSEIVNVVLPYWTTISSKGYLNYANIYTLIGTLYMFLGVYATYIYMLFLGAIYYFLRYVIFKNYYIGFQLTYAILLSFITLSFFNILYNHLVIYEISFLSIILPVSYYFIVKLSRSIFEHFKQQIILNGSKTLI